MLIAIDIREACREKPTGKGVWTKAVTTELIKNGDHTYLLLTDGSCHDFENDVNVEVIQLKPRLFSGWHGAAAALARSRNTDLFLATTSYITPLLLGMSVPFALIIHDLIAFQAGKHDRKAKLIERLCLPLIIRKARFLVTTTRAIREDIQQKFSGSLPVIHVCGAAADISVENSDSVAKSIILQLGTLCPRKNQLRTIQAYVQLSPELRSSHRLIIAGKRGWEDDDIVTLAAETEGVEWRSYVNDAELNALWQQAAAFVFPSLYEGFGLPVLEAQARGVPVVTSDKGALAEVAGDAAVFVDPLDPAAIANGLAVVLTDAAVRNTLIDAGYSNVERFQWPDVAAKLLSAIETD